MVRAIHPRRTAALTLMALACASGGLWASEPDRRLRPVVAANTDFGFDLFRAVAGAPKRAGRNLALSPYSISSALAMTYQGARNRTARQMARVLRWTGPEAGDPRAAPWPPARVHAAMGQLRRQLNASGKPYTLRVANSLWGARGFPFVPGFVEALRAPYGADGIRRVDFQGRPEQAREQINRWVEEQTDRRIKQLLPRRSVTRQTSMVLANAVYFQGKWAHPFDRRMTREGSFTLADGKKVEVPMMSQSDTSKLRCAWFEQGSLLELPYKGKELDMLILLPARRGQMAALLKQLSAARLARWIQGLAAARLSIRVPRFRLEASFGLTKTLGAMGMADAVDLSRADFTGLAPRRYPTAISAVVHKVFVSVDEAGTVAAAATAVVTASPPSTPRRLHCDRPFLFLIRDRRTGTILFLGRVSDPRGD